MPRFSEDDVIDYMVTEAIVMKLNKEEMDQVEQRKQRDWKSDFSNLEKHAS